MSTCRDSQIQEEVFAFSIFSPSPHTLVLIVCMSRNDLPYCSLQKGGRH